MTIIRGTSGADWLTGTEGFDKIHGYGGDDVLIAYDLDHAEWMWGGSGNDALYGGERSDRLYGQAGDDALFGDTNGGDLYVASGAPDRLSGGDGNDYLDGIYGDDVIHGGRGDDWLTDADGWNRMWGDAGADVLRGTGELDGGKGPDTLQNSIWGSSELIGGPGADRFVLELADTYPAVTVRVVDFNPAEGDRLLVHATSGPQQGGGYLFDAQGADAWKAFDGNGSGQLGDGDPYATGDGHGHVELAFWNMKVILPEEAAVTPVHWEGTAEWDTSVGDLGLI
jgi:Ca2+-binding RTX toxin-like protein